MMRLLRGNARNMYEIEFSYRHEMIRLIQKLSWMNGLGELNSQTKQVLNSIGLLSRHRRDILRN